MITVADGSKTEKATPKRRRDERKKGRVAVSKDVVMAVSLLGIYATLKICIPLIYRTLRESMVKHVKLISETADLNGSIDQIARNMGWLIVKAGVPILIGCMVLPILATGVQTKFLFTKSNLTPKFSRLNPLKGIKNIISVKSLVELVKNLIKILILGMVLYQMIKGDLRMIARTIDMDLKMASAHLMHSILNLILKAALVFLAIGGFDYFYQWWDFERQIRMSKQEIKEEFKQSEGNPEIKGRIRNLQRERARSRMMQDVPSADVIIRNPTHYAVALRYDIEKDNAPILLAKGQDEMALRIVAIAEENGIYVLSNPPLARGIHAMTQIGGEIPAEYYGVVAEILVYVYQINHRIIE